MARTGFCSKPHGLLFFSVDSNWNCNAARQFERQSYREAVMSQSPGLPLRLPWGTELDGRFNRKAVASIGATRSGLIIIWTSPQG
jgi:hypothetical protein